MIHLRRTGIRRRLALLYTGIFALCLTVFCTWLFQDFQRKQIAAFDTMLFNYTVDLTVNLEMDSAGRLFVVGSNSPEAGKFLPFGRSFIEFRNIRGERILSSRSLNDRDLPLGTDVLRRIGQERAVFAYVSADSLGVASSSPNLRLLTYWADRSTWAEPLIIQVAVPLDLPNQERRDLLWFFLIAIPTSLLIAALAGMWMSKFALRPVHEMTVNARGITGVENLKTRIPVPEANDEIRELAETFNGLLERLDRAFTSQDRFISNASHQLKTPLTILQGEIDLLRKSGVQGAELSSGLDSVADEIKRLIHLVQDLLLLARLEAGRDTLAFESVSLDDVLMKVVSRIQKLARNKDVQITTHFAAEKPGDELDVTVKGDEELIDSMLENFVENAVKYAPPRSIVALEMRSRPQGVEVTVRDSGPGISQELAGKIFERFTRGEPSSIVPGSGLGLSIAAEIARLHNVGIDLKSDGRDKGTAVKLTFPPEPNA
jgi:signal transduction histidine kinase